MTDSHQIANAEVVHNAAGQQFELRFAGHLCLLQYRVADGRMIIYHTEVPEAIEGRGLATRMTKAALDFARSENLRVQPRCSYAAAYIRKNPEYADLVG
jgi:uncharacterized protein